MKRFRYPGKLRILTLMLALCLFVGCSQKEDQKEDVPQGPPRDNTPQVLTPAADGTVTYGDDSVVIDASHTADGYVMVKYTGTCELVKVLFTLPDQTVYKYTLSLTGGYDVLPLTGGDGTYQLDIMEHVVDDQYATAFTQSLDVALSDEFLPFLYPNQYVWFTGDSKAVAKASSLAEECYSDLEVVQNIYHYVTENIIYDKEKAASVKSGYLPHVDETLETEKGICFDYASLMTSMFRSQGIPTRLEIGYTQELKHAWISTYLDEIGWVDNIIHFDGESWELMDPTLAASNGAKDLKKYIGDGSNYTLQYSY
jgi:transglutaminase-like putative cysteine protease